MVRSRPRYRMLTEGVEGVSTTLRDGALRTPARVVDISTTGVAIYLDDPGASADELSARWAQAGRLALVLEGDKVGHRFLIPLIVAHIQDVRGGALIGARFDVSAGRQRDMESEISRIFNRRGAVRVPPRINARMPVVIEGDCLEIYPVLGRIEDLSLTGVGLAVEAFAASVMQVGQLVKLRFKLDEDDEAIELRCRICHLRGDPDAGVASVGLRIEDADALHPRTSRNLCRWVTERLLEERNASPTAAARRSA